MEGHQHGKASTRAKWRTLRGNVSRELNRNWAGIRNRRKINFTWAKRIHERLEIKDQFREHERLSV